MAAWLWPSWCLRDLKGGQLEHTAGPDGEFLRPEGAERWLWLSLPEISLEVLTA